MHIMYVEDNADIRDMVVELIESTDRHVVACADAEMAWQRLQMSDFDVLITDVSLPGWSGTELARRWLEADATRWVILFSGYDFESGLAGLGANVQAIRKEDIDQLERTLCEIGRHLRGVQGAGAGPAAAA